MKLRQVRTIFQKLEVEVRDGKDVYGWVVQKGQKILRVHRSKGEGDVPGKVSDKIRQQLKLNEEQIKGLVSCEVGREAYLGILRGRGFQIPD